MKEILKLENQLCFHIYALSRKITSMYQPFLANLGITYPQYLVMLVLWEKESVNVKELGDCLLLDSGTLTPLLKRLEKNKLITRTRSDKDERIVIISLTQQGKKMEEQAANIPLQFSKHIKSCNVNPKYLQKLVKEVTGVIYQ
ncbi:MAG: MarR family transcriptional regulator [Daejeonella sp.]|uniref:MarR family winged helix-turn-helix transcriptional regulator n=1 Tax=unclassified Daejeonella TaxID=2805396 RepID=UPI0023EBF300|nr:MarR family transcriptional regulator [Daejeonella sp. JGW-45]